MTTQGAIDFRIRRQLQAYSKQDPPPHRVKPIPVSVIRHVLQAATLGNAASTKAIADMICIAFFFLMRPGEYTVSPSESTPFCLQDVQLFLGKRRLLLYLCTIIDLINTTFVTFTFTT